MDIAVSEQPTHRLRYAVIGALIAFSLILSSFCCVHVLNPQEFNATTDQARDILRSGMPREQCTAIGALQDDVSATLDELWGKSASADVKVARYACIALANIAAKAAAQPTPTPK